MHLNSAKQCRHCVCGACMGACARHLSHRRFGTYRNVVKASYNPVELDV